MPGKPGNFDIDEIREWMICEKLDRKPQEDDDSPTAEKFQKLQYQLEKAKTRKEKALAVQHEIKARLIDPKFVSSLEVNQFFSEFFTELRRNLVAIPVDMCASYPASYRQSVQQDLLNRLELFLNQMADFVDKFNAEHQITTGEHDLDSQDHHGEDAPTSLET